MSSPKYFKSLIKDTMNLVPNEHRPIGVTILGIWAIAGSFAAFGTVFNMMTEYQFYLDFLKIYGILDFLKAINAPMGGSYAFIELYTSVIFAIALLVIGILTLKIRNKGVWIANIGISVLALASLAWTSQYVFYSLAVPSYSVDDQSSKVILLFLALIAVSAIRLHYLLGRNVRGFFNRAPQHPFVTK